MMTQGDGWTCLWDADAVLGEGPVWVVRDRALWWVDIKAPAVHRYDPIGGDKQSFVPPWRIGAIAPRAAGGFIAATEQGFALYEPVSGAFELIVDPEPERPGNRFNDGKADADGSFWAGTMDDAEREACGALYRLDAKRRWQRVDDGYHVTNGPAFSGNGRLFYHTDSARQMVYAFDMDETGALSNKRVFLQFNVADGYPDGMTVDAEGGLWIAFWDGWCVRRFDKSGRKVDERRLPVARPTSLAFGGDRLDRLFVTSASIGIDQHEQPLAGGLFEILNPDVIGVEAGVYAG